MTVSHLVVVLSPSITPHLSLGGARRTTGSNTGEIKNSYGPEWGDEGFFRLERGRIGEHKFGTCGLLFESVYPVVTKAGDATSTDAPCVKGSVQKQTYYRNETLNPGLGDDDVEDEARIGVAQRRAHRAHGHAHRARKARLGDRRFVAPDDAHRKRRRRGRRSGLDRRPRRRGRSSPPSAPGRRPRIRRAPRRRALRSSHVVYDLKQVSIF